MDFLLLAGYDFVRGPIYERSSPEVRTAIKERYRQRRARLDLPTKIREGRVAKALLHPYASGEARTVGDLKRLVEQEGRLFNNFRFVSLATLNKALGACGLEPIRFGGYASESLLRRYGLEKYYPHPKT
ncbi:MAG: hypothetical protein HY459_01320 [Parcubacteria group bacterium]|nr:hypothetical protein [Parcubacteria group bacterium]